MPITASGTNLTTVVITCAQPVSRTPMMFTIVNSQIAPTATSAASQFDVRTSSQNTPRYPANATAIAAFPTQAAIQ